MRVPAVFVICFLGLCFLGAEEQAGEDTGRTEDAPPPVFSEAADGTPEEADGIEQTEAAEAAAAVPASLLNNRFYQESLRYTNLARLAFAEGDYDRSAFYSQEAARLALQSEEYINERLAVSRAERLLKEARERVAWAESSGAAAYYPAETDAAKEFYTGALAARLAADWNGTADLAQKAIDSLANAAAPPPPGAPVAATQPSAPRQYRVRPWDTFGDCLWNIAARFYGNPRLWPVLYKANKEKLPEEDNPDLLETGTLIDIPDIEGKERGGVYDSGLPYTPAPRTQKVKEEEAPYE